MVYLIITQRGRSIGEITYESNVEDLTIKAQQRFTIMIIKHAYDQMNERLTNNNFTQQ